MILLLNFVEYAIIEGSDGSTDYGEKNTKIRGSAIRQSIFYTMKRFFQLFDLRKC